MAVKRAKATAKKSSRTPAGAAPARKPTGAPPRRGAKPAARTAARPAAKSAARPAARPKPKPAAARPVPAKQVASKPKGKGAARPAAKPAATKADPTTVLTAIVISALEDMKAVNPTVLDVRGLTDIADTLIVASGNSDRHVRSIADRVIEYSKKAGYRPMGVEGERDGEWVLVDLQDVIVHVMLPRVREFYRLEDLWDVSAAARESAK
jgi:ribosome-associated protein